MKAISQHPAKLRTCPRRSPPPCHDASLAISWLQAMAPLNLFEARDLLTPAIASCNISLYYYGGFCYLMQRRYLDAARAFNTILAFIHR